jgi:hypothetical protein
MTSVPASVLQTVANDSADPNPAMSCPSGLNTRAERRVWNQPGVIVGTHWTAGEHELSGGHDGTIDSTLLNEDVGARATVQDVRPWAAD